MIDIISKEICTGCKMCKDLCPHGAISFKTEKNGFWYPHLESEKCTKCGLCVKKCPVSVEYSSPNNDKPNVYSAWIKEDEIRLKSTSGGVYYALAEKVIKDGGTIIGCVYSEDFKSAYHFAGNTLEDLKHIMGSKYFQSDTEGIYGVTKKLLSEGKKVLFCGTPCHIAALNNYLSKNYDNLVTCDFVCRGINSPKAFRKYLEDLEERYDSKVISVHLKNKSRGWIALGTYIKFSSGKTYYRNRANDPWVNGYVGGSLYMRDCCFDCHFKKIPRNSDLSFGDFWGLKGSKDDLFKGISLVMVNSDKGNRLFESILNRVNISEQTLEKAIDGNQCIVQSATSGIKRKEFFACIDEEGFIDLVWRLLGQSRWKIAARSIKYKIKKIMGG